MIGQRMMCGCVIAGDGFSERCARHKEAFGQPSVADLEARLARAVAALKDVGEQEDGGTWCWCYLPMLNREHESQCLKARAVLAEEAGK